MAARSHATQTAITRAIKAATKAGLDVSRVDVAPDGTVRVLTGATEPTTDFDQWKAKRDGASAA